MNKMHVHAGSVTLFERISNPNPVASFLMIPPLSHSHRLYCRYFLSSLYSVEDGGFPATSHIVYLFALAVACFFASLCVASNQSEKQTSNKQTNTHSTASVRKNLYFTKLQSFPLSLSDGNKNWENLFLLLWF